MLKCAMNLDKNQECSWILRVLFQIFDSNCRSSPWIPEHWKDDALLAELKKKNEEKIAALDKKIADAEELEGMTHEYYQIIISTDWIWWNVL